MWPGKSIKIMFFSVLTFFENLPGSFHLIEIEIGNDISHEQTKSHIHRV